MVWKNRKKKKKKKKNGLKTFYIDIKTIEYVKKEAELFARCSLVVIFCLLLVARYF